ncbi:hypothetical protein BLNAU_24897 [Blattamonas nauphoetae]|uniref:Uncharacterized protein n=1 Tax=Blattamonas nauphoetae TaxID=2049346 RepID=A0ABQ9WQ94_9EUKA|nr:hypothetical protein BLNAU_24897 [Blattamonas nauphoetae]
MSLARSEFKNVENSFAACRSSGNEGAVNIECSKSVWSSSLVVYSYFSQCSQQSTGQPQRSTRIISSSIGVPPPLLAWQFVRSVEQTFKQKMSESVEIVILKSSTPQKRCSCCPLRFHSFPGLAHLESLRWKTSGNARPSLLHTNEKMTEQQGKPSRSRSGDEIVFCKHSFLIFCNCGKILT